MIDNKDNKKNSLKKFYKKAKGRLYDGKFTVSKNRMLSIALLVGVGFGLSSNAITPDAAIDLTDRREYTTLSLYNPETLQFEYVISTEADENWHSAGYAVEKMYTTNISGLVGNIVNEDADTNNSGAGSGYGNGNGNAPLVSNANLRIREGWRGLVTSKHSSKGIYSEAAANADAEAKLVKETYPYSWNGSYKSFDGGLTDGDMARLSASGQDYSRATTVLNALTDELNTMLNYITHGELLDLNDSTLSSNEGYILSLHTLNNRIVTAANTGETVSGYITDDLDGECTPGDSASTICYPYTITKQDTETFKSLTKAQKQKIEKTNKNLIYGDDPNGVANQYLLVTAENNDIDYLGNSSADTASSIGEVFLYTVPKGYNDKEVLNGYIATNLSKSDKATSYKDLGILNDYTTSMIIAQALNIYTNDGSVASSSFDVEAFKNGVITEEGDDGFFANALTKVMMFLYDLIGAYPMNEAISPFENGMTYNYVYYFTPPALVGLLEIATSIVTGLAIMILTIITLQRVFYIRQNKYNAEEMKPVELFKDVVAVSLAGVANVILIPFYVGIGRGFTAMFVLLGTPPGMTPGTYEIGAGLFGSGLSQLGNFISWGIQMGFAGFILFACLNIMIRFLLGPLVALGFFENKEGGFWDKFFEYHKSTLWLCVGKFALWAFGYAMLANLQYREDLGIFVGVVLLSAVMNLPAMVEKMLGLKFHTLEDGIAHVGAGVAAASSSLKTAKGGTQWAGRAAGHKMDGAYAKNKEKMEDAQNNVNAIKEKMDRAGGGTQADGAALAQAQASLNKLQDKSNKMVKRGQRWNTAVAPFVGGRVDSGRFGNEINKTGDSDGGERNVNSSLAELKNNTGESDKDFKARLMHQQNAMESAEQGQYDPEATSKAFNNLSDSEKDNLASKFDKASADEKADMANSEAIMQLTNAQSMGETLAAGALAEKTARFESQRQMNASFAEQKMADIKQDAFKDLTAGEMAKVDSSDIFNKGSVAKTEGTLPAGSNALTDVSGDKASAGFGEYVQGLNNGRATTANVGGVDGAEVDVAVDDGFAKDLVAGYAANSKNTNAKIYDSKSQLQEAIKGGQAINNGGYYKNKMGGIRQLEFVEGARGSATGELITSTKAAGGAQTQVEQRRIQTLQSTRSTNEAFKGARQKSGGNSGGGNGASNESVYNYSQAQALSDER